LITKWATTYTTATAAANQIKYGKKYPSFSFHRDPAGTKRNLLLLISLRANSVAAAPSSVPNNATRFVATSIARCEKCCGNRSIAASPDRSTLVALQLRNLQLVAGANPLAGK
jgi:hypothetical protein